MNLWICGFSLFKPFFRDSRIFNSAHRGPQEIKKKFYNTTHIWSTHPQSFIRKLHHHQGTSLCQRITYCSVFYSAIQYFPIFLNSLFVENGECVILYCFHLTATESRWRNADHVTTESDKLNKRIGTNQIKPFVNSYLEYELKTTLRRERGSRSIGSVSKAIANHIFTFTERFVLQIRNILRIWSNETNDYIQTSQRVKKGK